MKDKHGKYDSNEDTAKHIQRVWELGAELQEKFQKQIIEHDHSKTRSPEKEIFDEYTPKFKNSTYGSEEYKGFLVSMKVALDHHYSHNRHHPEYHKNGIKGMDLIDIIEMLCDWKAATERHSDGDIIKSIKLNAKRFGYGGEMLQMLMNTAVRMGWEKAEGENGHKK